MHCNGKCYLKKQLNKIDDSKQNEKELPNLVSKLKSIDNFIMQQETACVTPKIILFSQNKYRKFSQVALLSGHYGTPFHPPQFS